MSQEIQNVPISRREVIYEAPAVDAVTTRHDVEFRGADGGVLTMDVYAPRDATSAPLPAVVIVAGYRDEGFQKVVGCRFKEMQSTVSWAGLIAASGIVAIAYTNREPATDVFALLEAVRRNATSMRIDASRIGLWASSGNAPVALSVLMHDSPERVKCAVLCYGYALDVDGSTDIADAAAMFRFANPGAGRSVDDLRSGTPLFVLRAGRDETPRLNESLDRFLIKALARNLPISFVNHADGPHAFDLFHDSDTTREIIRQVLVFFQFHLGAASRNFSTTGKNASGFST